MTKPCKICGSTDRFASGPCRPCAKRRVLSPQERREYQKQWYSENKEKHNLRQRRWRNAHPEYMREWYCTKDARRRQASGRLSKGIVEELLRKQRGLCACCGRELSSDYHIDHIMPIALGGTNTDDNVQLLLAECNMRKGAKHPDEWRKTLAHKPGEGV